MVTFKIDKILKNSVRYAQPNKKVGPATVYVPRDMFKDPENPPATIKMAIQV